MSGGAFSVTVEGAVLSGESAGPGTPLVLVHGMAGDRREWDGLLAALPADFAALRYDLRGFGRSAAEVDAAFSHADDLLALLDSREIAHAPVLGLSLGGGIALNFALNHPERVSRLILISPAVVGWEWSDEWQALWRRTTDPARAGDMGRARREWCDHPMFAALRRDPEAAEHLRRSVESYHGRQWIKDGQRDELPDIDRLHELAMPCLLLNGELDLPDMRLIADVIAAAAPDVERIDFADAGHMLHAERTSEVASAVIRFLKGGA
jgi:2-succinyl-6-hydroxy-2,4-cyclohexadiene-1-carboxylate synthase